MKNNRGFAVSMALCVAGVVLVMGMGAAQLCAGDLSLATHDLYQERARQVADFGLESGLSSNLSSESYVFKYATTAGLYPNDQSTVTVYDNLAGNLPANSGCPVKVPPGYQYWTSQGQCREGSSVLAKVTLGALVRWGQPLGSAGAQVKYLSIPADSPAIAYSAVDKDNLEVDDQVICSTESRQNDLALPNGLGLVKPMTFNKVTSFGGKIKIPQGSEETEIVQYNSLGAAPTVDPTGGFFNIPKYTPPQFKQQFGTVTVPAGDFAELTPGYYETLEIGGGANVQLNGVYHIKNLKLLPNPTPMVARLSLAATGTAEVYLDKLTNNSQYLGLSNPRSASSTFKFNLKPALADSDPEETRIRTYANSEGGGINLLAPNHTVRLNSGPGRLLRGSFCCGTLVLEIPPGFNSDVPPKFVFDSTAAPPKQKGFNLPDGVSGDPGGGEEGEPSSPTAMILTKAEL